MEKEVILYNSEDEESSNYEITKFLYRSFQKENIGILFGTIGRWNGTFKRVRFVRGIKEFFGFFEHLDEYKIKDVNGHLIIEGYHHDGSDRYEFKLLTDKGKEIADKNEHDYHLVAKLSRVNLFSKLPRVFNYDTYTM